MEFDTVCFVGGEGEFLVKRKLCHACEKHARPAWPSSSSLGAFVFVICNRKKTLAVSPEPFRAFSEDFFGNAQIAYLSIPPSALCAALSD